MHIIYMVNDSGDAVSGLELIEHRGKTKYDWLISFIYIKDYILKSKIAKPVEENSWISQSLD